MNHVFKSSKTIMVVIMLSVCITFIAWRKANSTTPKFIDAGQTRRDTSHPGKHAAAEYRVDDLDKAMQQLDVEMKKMDEQMKKMDFPKIENQVKEAIEKVDFEKIKLETREALKKVDWDKIKLEVDNAMKQAEANFKKIDVEKFKKQMDSLQEKLKKGNLTVKIDAEKIHKEVEQDMMKAKEGIKKTKLELKSLENFIDALHRDGLIDKKKDYTIKVEDGELFINGIKQSKEAFEKYKQYYKKENFSINSNENDMPSR